MRRFGLRTVFVLLLGAGGLPSLARAAVPPEAGDQVLARALVLKVSEDLTTRTGMSLDPIEARIVRGGWKTPKAGDAVAFGDGAERSWQLARADAKGWFELDALEGGYAYFTVESSTQRIALLEGAGHDMVFVNGEPRSGCQYHLRDEREVWEPRFDISVLPIELRRGKNDLLFKCYRGRLKVRLRAAKSAALLNANDLTIPDLMVGRAISDWGGIVVINASTEPLRGYALSTTLSAGVERSGEDANRRGDAGGRAAQREIGVGQAAPQRARHATPDGASPVVTPVPVIPPLSIRKVGFRIEGPPPATPGPMTATVKLERSGYSLDTLEVQLEVVTPGEPYRRTFTSAIDGSVQYFAVNPARDRDAGSAPALILSLHGAAVEGFNQAKSYESKRWAHIVAPTNRRPYGFNWEDWGQLDALEVLAHAQQELKFDPERVYLTGHSMGGHGTWHIGETFPDRFAAIGPSAGWLSFWSYRARKPPDASTPIGAILARAASPSDTIALSDNLRRLGVYVLHGADDDNVLVAESRRMVEHLSRFHKDLVYHEQPKVGHWWDLSDEPGTDCVDWPPMFDMFARRTRAGSERVRQVDFMTASPGISSRSDWVEVEAQVEPLSLSSVSIRVDPGLRRFSGTTKNVARLVLDLESVISGGEVSVELDGQKLTGIPYANASPEVPRTPNASPGHVGSQANRIWLERRAGNWAIAPPTSPAVKGPQRYGTFKDAFRNRVLFVYGTKGSPAENTWAFAKARYDSERFWYQGNGSIEVRPDIAFDTRAEPDRNVILYGNSRTNAAWKALLGGSPVQVDGKGVTVGERHVAGADLACLFIRPRPGSTVASVGAVAGTGIVGMRLTNNKLYLEAGYPFPDLLLFSASSNGPGDGIVAVGFFDLDWSVGRDFAWGR